MESVLLSWKLWLWIAMAVFAASLFLPKLSNGGWRYWLRRLLGLRVFGSARWARAGDLRRAGLTKQGGLFLGRSGFTDIYHSGEGHLFTLGGTGGGKSSGLVVPTLLNLTEGSVIVTDPSGELAAMTARRRAEIGPVVFLNPFAETFRQGGEGLDFRDDGFNPFSVLDPQSPNFISDTQKLAQLLMVTDRRESGSYWNDEGAEFLALMIAKVKLYDHPDLHNLAFLHGVVRDNIENIKAVLGSIIQEGHPALVDEAQRFLDLAEVKPQWFGVASKVALATKRYAPSTPLGEHTKKDGLDLHRLKTETMTVYVMVPSSMLTVALPWLNLLVGLFSQAVGRPGPARPVTMLIDEAPSLGYLPDLRSAMAQHRKAGLRVWLFTQTYAALAAPDLYGQEGIKEILGLSTIKQFFAVDESEVQKIVSDMAGQRSVSNPSSTGNMGDVGQPLIRPDEVRGLRKWRQVILRGGMQFPIKARLVPYFNRARWRSMVDRNPYRGGQ